MKKQNVITNAWIAGTVLATIGCLALGRGLAGDAPPVDEREAAHATLAAGWEDLQRTESRTGQVRSITSGGDLRRWQADREELQRAWRQELARMEAALARLENEERRLDAELERGLGRAWRDGGLVLASTPLPRP